MDKASVVCFLEDLMQEQMIHAIVRRIVTDLGVHPRSLNIRSRNSSGGHPAAIGAFDRYAEDLERGNEPLQDLVVLAVDTDCRPEVRRELAGVVERIARLTCVGLALPDPYVERWYLLDAEALKKAVGSGPEGAYPRTCDRSYYKTELRKVLRASGAVPILGGYEYADLIVPEMDLYQCGRLEPGLGRFIEDIRACVRLWSHRAGERMAPD